jgi:hypothetical protein
MIVHNGDKWIVKDSSGEKTLGTHSSKEAAQKQLTAIELSKKKRKTFKEHLEENYNLTFQYHDDLNPQLWENNKLKNDIREKLIEIGKTWTEWVNLPPESVLDFTFVGGNASYAYTPHSDIDLHVLVDKSKIADCPELIDDYLKDKKQLWSLTHNISILGHDVEIYAQDISEPVPEDQGAYSLTKDEWLTKPAHVEHDVDSLHVQKKVSDYIHKIEDLISSNAEDEAFEKLKDKIKNMRSAGLKKSGELSVENVVFKELRNLGYLDKMTNYVRSTQDQRLSM